MPGLVDTYIADQAHCVFLPNGDPIVDYIGSAEDLDVAWAGIVAGINGRAGTAFEAVPLERYKGSHVAEDGVVENLCGSAMAAAVITHESAYSLARHYALDIAVFGYAVVT